MKKTFLATAVLLAFSASTMAQSLPIQGGTINGDGGKIDNQLMGDTANTVDNSTSKVDQNNNSTAAIGNDLGNKNDVRVQATDNSVNTTSSSAKGNELNSDNKSQAINGGMSSDNKSSANSGDVTSKNVLGAKTGDNNGTIKGTLTGTVKGENRSENNLAQGIKDSGNAAVKASGNSAVKTATTTAQDQKQAQQLKNIGNSRMAVDARNQSVYNSKTTILPALMAGPGVAPVPGAAVSVVTSACMPLRALISKPVYGIRLGPAGGEYQVYLGETQSTMPYTNAKGETLIDYNEDFWKGERTVTYVTVVTVSTQQNIGGGLFGNNGGGGQAQLGAGGALQRMVKEIEIEECFIPKVKAPIIYQDSNLPVIENAPQ